MKIQAAPAASAGAAAARTDRRAGPAGERGLRAVGRRTDRSMGAGGPPAPPMWLCSRDEGHRRPHVRRGQSDPRLRRPLLHPAQARDRRRHRGARRGLRRHRVAAPRRAHDRGRRRALRRRARAVPHRGDVARRVRVGLRHATRPDARRRPLGHRDRALGHRGQGARQAGLRAARRDACASGCAATATSTPGRRTPTDAYLDPELGAERAAEYAGARLHCDQVRSRRRLCRARPAPALARRPRPLRALRRGGARARSAPASTCCSARTGSSRRRAPSASRGGSSASIRSGSRSRRRPRHPRRWRASRARRRSRSRPASA